MLSGRAESGRASKKPDSKNCCPGLARPDCRAAFSCPSPARRAKKNIELSGRRAGPSLNLSNLLPRPGPTCQSGQISLPRLGPSGQNKRSAGPFSGQAGSGRRAGLPMLRYTYEPAAKKLITNPISALPRASQGDVSMP
jgi:hypothetical protein